MSRGPKTSRPAGSPVGKFIVSHPEQRLFRKMTKKCVANLRFRIQGKACDHPARAKSGTAHCPISCGYDRDHQAGFLTPVNGKSFHIITFDDKSNFRRINSARLQHSCKRWETPLFWCGMDSVSLSWRKRHRLRRLLAAWRESGRKRKLREKERGTRQRSRKMNPKKSEGRGGNDASFLKW